MVHRGAQVGGCVKTTIALVALMLASGAANAFDVRDAEPDEIYDFEPGFRVKLRPLDMRVAENILAAQAPPEKYDHPPTKAFRVLRTRYFTQECGYPPTTQCLVGCAL